MIQAKDILLKLTEETAVKKIYKDPVAISVNPRSLSAAFRDLRTDVRDSNFKTEPILKFLYYHHKKQLIIWCAFQATHDDLLDIYGEDDDLWGAIDTVKKTFSAYTVSAHSGGSERIHKISQYLLTLLSPASRGSTSEYLEIFFRELTPSHSRIERVPAVWSDKS